MKKKAYRVASKDHIQSMVGVHNIVGLVFFGIYNEHNSQFDKGCGELEMRWINIGPFITAEMICPMYHIDIIAQFIEVIADWPKDASVSHPMSVQDFCQFLEQHGFERVS